MMMRVSKTLILPHIDLRTTDWTIWLAGWRHFSRLGTNATYLSEVIRRSGYQSFYDMICQHRVRYAISLIHQQPDCRMSDIADRCGFSSPASMAKAFQSQGKAAPSTFRKSLSV